MRILKVATATLILIAHSAGSSGQETKSNRKSEAIERARYFIETGRLLEGGKVVDGVPAKVGDDPWQVALIFPLSTTNNVARLFCGGSLIARDWVLTAAHCVDGATDVTDFAVLVGGIDLYAPRVPRRADRIIVHPGWLPAPRRLNDVALLHLTTVQPVKDVIALVGPSASPDSVPVGLIGRVTGWGAVGETGGATQFLRMVEVSTVSRADCSDEVSYPGRIAPGMFCAGFGIGGRDSCKGDSGGPLSAIVEGRRRLVGVVSWGDGCGKPAKYGVYTRVAGYIGWIRACIAGSVNCIKNAQGI
jgi:secreted trypsin-like serine protease